MRRVRHIHLVGIGGSGMSGIAEILLSLGYRVSGSDAREGEAVRRLRELGAAVAIGHMARNLTDADVVVVSSAIGKGNPEVDAARTRGIPVIPRAEMLAELGRLKYGIAIAGSHGKTTTTSLVGHVLAKAGLDPTVIIGGRVPAIGSGARPGQGEFLVAEADESDGSFLKLAPTIAVVTNIDAEHLDHYGSFEALRATFLDFCRKVPFYGLAVLCLDHPEVAAMIPRVDRRHFTYGFAPGADFSARDVRADGMAMRFTLVRSGRAVGDGLLPMPGAHNVQNALAALAVAEELDVPLPDALAALAGFGGIDRRFTVRGEARGVLVVDDYGHHPAEIRATLAAARALGRRLVVAFQPHRYTRTRDLMSQFARAFSDADAVAVAPIYAAGEEPIPGVSAEHLVDALRAAGHPRASQVARKELAAWLAREARSGDAALTLGAGDVTQVGEELLALLRAGSA
ncbi:MAG: UDP-N-acetylmuramate--L-alanine ligase [Myxococcota bacterium]